MISNEDFQAVLAEPTKKFTIPQQKIYSHEFLFSESDPWELLQLFSSPEASKLLVTSSTLILSEYLQDYQMAFRLFRISILIALFAILVSVFGALRSFWSQPGYVPLVDELKEEKLKNVVSDLRERAASQRNQAALILLMITGSCSTSFLLFYTAEDLVSSHFDASMSALQGSIFELSQQVSDLNYELSGVVQTISMNSQDRESVSKSTEQSLQSLNSMINRTRFAELSSIPAESMIVAQEGKNMLISTLLVRVGSITIAIFIVFMLAPAYRYSTNLASFYDSRADSLSLSVVEDTEGFRILIEHLDPPRHEAEKKLINLVNRLIKKVAESPRK